MKRLLLFLAALPALSQTCGQLMSTQALTFNEPHYGPRAPGQLITVNLGLGPTNWSRVGAFTPYTFFADASNVNTNSTSTSVYVVLQGTVDAQAIANGYTENSTIQFDPGAIQCTITSTYNVIATGSANNRFTNNLGIPDSALAGATAPGGIILGYSLIPTSTIGSLPGGVDLRPANGATTVSAEWGTTIKRCGPDGYVHVYSSINALNSDNSVISTTALRGGGLVLIDTATCTAHTITGVANVNTIVWDWAWKGHVPQNNRAWAFSGVATNTIIEITFNFSAWTATFTTPYTYAGATVIGNGGTDDINNSGYIAYVTDKDHAGSTAHPNICALKIGAWSEICADFSSVYPDGVTNPPNNVELSKDFDSRTNKAYLITNTAGGTPTYGPRYSFRVGDTSLTFEDYWGLEPEANLGNSFGAFAAPWPIGTPCSLALGQANRCVYTGSHAHTVADSAGRQYWAYDGGLIEPSSGAIALIDMSLGSAFQTISKYMPGVTGGFDIGLNVGAVNSTTSPFNGEMGCVQDWCVTTGITQTLTSWKITNVTAFGGTSTITLDCPSGTQAWNGSSCVASGNTFVTGQSAVIGNVGGCTQLNSATGWPGGSVTVSGSTVTITGTGNCPSSYTASTGGLAKNTYPGTFNYRQEVILLHVVNGSVIETRRIGNTYSQSFSDTYTEAGDYWPRVGATPARDFSLVVVNSNGGKPDEDAILLMTTGLPRYTLGGKSVLSGKNVIQ